MYSIARRVYGPINGYMNQQPWHLQIQKRRN
jgi:hypothetical protein